MREGVRGRWASREGNFVYAHEDTRIAEKGVEKTGVPMYADFAHMGIFK